MSIPIYMRRIGQEKYHLLREVMGEYAYTECDQIFAMRRGDAQTTLGEPEEGTCGICRSRQALRASFACPNPVPPSKRHRWDEQVSPVICSRCGATRAE